MRIRLTLWSLLCLLLTGQALQANAQDVVAVGAQITSESSIVSGKAYVLQYLATGTPYITENNGQYSLPNSQNQATEASTYYLISNGDGTWKIKNYYSGKCWGVPVYNTALAAADESAAGTWSLNFSGGIAYPSAPDADGTVRGIDRSSQKMLGHGTGTGITKRIKIFEVPLSTTALSELISHDISIASEAAATVETGQWYVMSQRTRSSYVYEDVTTHTLKHTQTKPSGKATTNASYLVQLVSGTDGNYYIKNGLGNYIGQIIASTNVPTTALKEEQHAVQKINNTDGHYSVQCISNSVVLNANDFTLGDPATVVGWETTAPAATGSNNDWAFYPVELIPTASEVYTLNNTNNNRGALVYNGTSNNVALVASANLNASNANHQWVLYPTATDGQYYLYNVGAGKFAIPTSIAQDDQNAWVFSNNAVAVTLLNQGNGKFRIKMATNPVNGTNAAVLGVNINRTPAVFNYNDAGSDFAFTLVEGANASTQVEAAVGKLVDNQTALSAVPASGTNSWYVIRIKTHGTFANRYVYPAATEQTYNNTNYPLTFDHDIDIRPAINEVKYFTRISNTNNKVYWQMPNGKYLYGDENKFPISTLTEKTFSMAYSDNGFYMWGSSRYAVPYYLGSKYFIGETSSVNAYYDIYPIDLEDAGLVPWKVNISENPSDRQVTCARNDVSGLTAVYNNGYFFLPDDVTPSASDFTTASYNGKTPDFVIDTENHLITVNYLFTSDKVYTITNTNEGATRGSLIYNPDNTKWVWASGKSGTFDASQANSQWVFIPTGTANQYYLYNVGAGKFAIPMKGGTYGNGNSYSWGFSDNAVAIKLIQQSDGSFKMYSVTHNVVISISTNYTGPVIFFDDNGAKFNISLVDGQNQSDVANAAKEKLVKNIPALTAVPTADDGWYVMQIRTSATSSHIGRYVYAAESEYTYNNVSYPLTFTGEIDVQPAVDDATFYTRLVKSGEYFYWQMPNGKFLKYNSSKFPISDATGSTVLAGYDNGNYMKASSYYAVPYHDGTNFFIGESTTYRTYYMYPIDLSTAGLTAWQVTISGGDADIKLVCNTTGVSGLNSVYNNGYIFLPTGTTPASSDFAYSDGANIYVEVDDTEKTILAVYNPDDEGIKTDNTQVIQGNETTGKGNTMQALLRVKLSPLTHSTPTSVEVALTGHDLLDKVAVYTTTIDEIHAEGANPQKVGEVTAGATVTIPVTMGTIRAGQTIYMWITGDVKSSATELATIDAAITSITYNNILGNSTVCDLSSVGNPEGQMCVFKQQTFLWTPDHANQKYYRIPTMINTADGGIVALTDYRHEHPYDLGKNASNGVGAHVIDVEARRSTDGGLTWQAAQTIAAGDGTNAASWGYGDPAIVRDADGTLHCLMAAGPNSYATGMLHMGYVTSSDNGATWTEPVDLYTQTLENGNDRLDKGGLTITSAFTTGGKGVTFDNGRMAFAFLGKVGGKTNIYPLYSDDKGATWHVSPTPAYSGGDESKFEIMNDNSLMVSVRKGNYNGTANRSHNQTTGDASAEGIATWGTAADWTDMNANGCNADILYYSRSTEGEQDILLHTLTKSYNTYRKDLRLYMSVDQGATWTEIYQLQAGYAAYSSMQKLANGDLAIIFEDGSIGNKDKQDCYAINYIVLDKEQITGKYDMVFETRYNPFGFNQTKTYTIKNESTAKYISSNAEAETGYAMVTANEAEAAQFVLIPEAAQKNYYYMYDTVSGNYLLPDNTTEGLSARWTWSVNPTSILVRDYTYNNYATANTYTFGKYCAAAGKFNDSNNSGDHLANFKQASPSLAINHWFIEVAADDAAVEMNRMTAGVENLVESAALLGTQLKYTAKVGSAARGTVVIPFDADVTGAVEAYTLTAVDGNSNLQGTKVETIEANKPVLLKNSGTLVLTAMEGTLEYADAPVNGFLHGVYTPTEAPEGSYVLQKQGDVVAFFHVEDIHPTVGAFRAYLETPGNARMLTINFDGETTGINSIDNGQLIMDNGAVYDLQGRKVNLELTKGGETLPRGLYIINGKKVVIK